MKNEKGIQMIISGALATFAVYMGALAVPIIVLMVMMVLDYFSGMAVAWIQNNLSSKIGAKGIIKKVGYMGLIVVAMGADYLIYSGIIAANIDISYNMWFGLLVAVWLIINEMMGSYGSPLYDKYELLIKENLTDEEEYIFFSVLMSDKSDFRLIDNPQSVGALKTIYGKLPDIWAEMENIYLNYI